MTDSAARAGSLRATVDAVDAQETLTPLTDAGDLFSRRVSTYERLLKPVIDRVGAAILIVLTSLLFVAIAIAIRVTMGPPIILRQARVGQYGKIFTLYKFRTMKPDRRRAQVPFVGVDRRVTHKHPDDPRITPLGHFLRKWSLDEIPQFFNVLRGDMSLVGPRPEMLEIVAKYEPWQHRRHSAKPGITGPWQISQRGEVPLHESTESDIDYVSDITALRDLRILALTPIAALGLRKGS